MDSRMGSGELGARRGRGLPHKARLGLPAPLTGTYEAPHSLNLSERAGWSAPGLPTKSNPFWGDAASSGSPTCAPSQGFFPRLGPGLHRQEVMEAQAGGRLPRAGCGQVFPGLRAVMVWSEDRGQAETSGEQHAGRPRPRLGGSLAPHEPLTFLGNPGKRTPALGEGGRGGKEGPGSGAAQLPKGGGQQVARPGAALASLLPAFTWRGWGRQPQPWADCIRQTIIDPALVYPWCLISINNSLKELAGDSGSLLPPFSFAPIFLWICQEWEIYDDPRKILLCCRDTAAALLFACPTRAAGKACRMGAARWSNRDMSSNRLLTLGASLGREGVIPEPHSGLRPGLGRWLSRGLIPPLQRWGRCQMWGVCACAGLYLGMCERRHVSLCECTRVHVHMRVYACAHACVPVSACVSVHSICRSVHVHTHVYLCVSVHTRICV